MGLGAVSIGVGYGKRVAGGSAGGDGDDDDWGMAAGEDDDGDDGDGGGDDGDYGDGESERKSQPPRVSSRYHDSSITAVFSFFQG